MSLHRLSTEIRAHDSDIKALLEFNLDRTGHIVSASRDHTVRDWKLTSEKRPVSYTASKHFQHHQHYVNALAYYPPTEIFPEGLILSAGSDKIIYAYPPAAEPSEDPLYALIGHEENVCSLYVVSNRPDSRLLLSASWDKTIRVWEEWEEKYTLRGHEAAVWSVIAMTNGNWVSGSADKTIRIWKRDKCIQVVTGHTDVVRCLVSMPLGGFASASNDCEIRLWSDDGACLNILQGHNAFIYTLTLLPGGELISAGEDRTIHIWKDGKAKQVIPYPANSIWTLIPLRHHKGDFACAGSDGIVRVFTSNNERMASEEAIKEYEEKVSSTSISSKQLGDIDIASLPGPEALTTNGKHKEGQVMLVKSNEGVEAHQWSEADHQWIKVGHVVHGSDQSKQMWEGKEYDHIFSIEIEDGLPPLKLPYQNYENPFAAAQQFILKHELPISYLDQIADFIIKNSSPVSLGTNYSSPYSDTNSVKEEPIRIYYRGLLTANKTAMMKKLREVINKSSMRQEIGDENLSSIESLLNHLLSSSTDSSTTLKLNESVRSQIVCLLKLPSEDLLPVLDLMRVILADETVYKHLSLPLFDDYVKIAERGNIDDSLASKHALLLYRALINMMLHESGRQDIISHISQVSHLLELITPSLLPYQPDAYFINNFLLLCTNDDSLKKNQWRDKLIQSRLSHFLLRCQSDSTSQMDWEAISLIIQSLLYLMERDSTWKTAGTPVMELVTYLNSDKIQSMMESSLRNQLQRLILLQRRQS